MPKTSFNPNCLFQPYKEQKFFFYLCNLLFGIQRPKYLKCGTFGQQTKKVGQMPHQNKFYTPLLVLGPKETQVWFLIFVIFFLGFSAQSTTSVVLLVNKHQKFVKCPTKTSFKPNCLFQPYKERSEEHTSELQSLRESRMPSSA